MKTLIRLALVTLMALTPISADAHGWRGGYGNHGYRSGLGIWWGASAPMLYYSPYTYSYPSPYSYYNPSTVIIERTVPVAPVVQAPQQQYWYYCESSASYYPYTPSCLEGWRTVPASPPGAPAR